MRQRERKKERKKQGKELTFRQRQWIRFDTRIGHWAGGGRKSERKSNVEKSCHSSITIGLIILSLFFSSPILAPSLPLFVSLSDMIERERERERERENISTDSLQSTIVTNGRVTYEAIA